jgi:hypothetical protein
MLDMLVTGRDTLVFTVGRQRFRDEVTDFWDQLHAALAALPETEKERRRRIAARRLPRLTDSHPPAHLRIAVLRGRRPDEPALRLTAIEEEKIRVELSAEYARVASQLRAAAQEAR